MKYRTHKRKQWMKLRVLTSMLMLMCSVSQFSWASDYCEVAWEAPDVYLAIETECTPTGHIGGYYTCEGGCSQVHYSYYSDCVMSEILVDVHCVADTSRAPVAYFWTLSWWYCQQTGEDYCEGCDLSQEGETIGSGWDLVQPKTDAPGCGG